MYRYKKSVRVSYDKQGYIYFFSRLYNELDPDAQAYIRKIAGEAGGEHAEAVMRYVTTDDSATKICAECYLSKATLHRAVAKYYELF